VWIELSSIVSVPPQSVFSLRNLSNSHLSLTKWCIWRAQHVPAQLISRAADATPLEAEPERHATVEMPMLHGMLKKVQRRAAAFI
jgi:hypothetical protein